MNTAHNIFQKFSSFTSTKVSEYMKEKYALDEERILYIYNNVKPLLVPGNVLCDKLFINYYDKDMQDALHRKYFNSIPLNICHQKSLDTRSFMSTLIFYDGIDLLFSIMNNTIQVNEEEIVFCFIVFTQANYFNDVINESVKLFKET